MKPRVDQVCSAQKYLLSHHKAPVHSRFGHDSWQIIKSIQIGRMFKNKILVKATPSPSHSSFFLLPLSLPSSSCTTGPPLSVDLEILSWKLSRKWRLACLAQPFDILVVYQVRSSLCFSTNHGLLRKLRLLFSLFGLYVHFDAEISVGFGRSRCFRVSQVWSLNTREQLSTQLNYSILSFL